MEKPPVLSDEELKRMALDCFGSRDGIRFVFPSRGEKIQEAMEDVAEAQRDADVEWYEKKMAGAINLDVCDARKQARQETAREIFEEILTTESLEIGRKAIEDMLVECRDSRLSEFTRGNGLVIREKDGEPSDVIRFGSEAALRIGITAMKQSLKSKYLEV